MFLKKDDFEYNGKKIVMFELSGLQRVEYMEFLAVKTKPFESVGEKDNSNEQNAAFYRINIEINAWLVSRSLWNADNKQDVEKLYQSTISGWSSDALDKGAAKVLSISNMEFKKGNEEPLSDLTDGEGQAETISAEKP